MPETFAGCRLDRVDGLPVLWGGDDRFKGFRLVLCWQRPLDQRAAARALLPALLLHGTASHPDRPSLARAMERLYGAWAGPGVGRFAETQVFRLAAEAVAGEYLPDRPDQIGGVLRLLEEFATRPRLTGGAFPADVFARERDHAVASARAVFEEKAAWARQQAVAHACAGEPYAEPEHGGEAELAALDAAAPEMARCDFLAAGRRWCVALGAVPGDLPRHLAALLQALPRSRQEALPPVVQPARRAARRHHERAVLQQGKLVLVFRFPVPTGPAAAAALQVFASLWGGGPHSRLFQHVRQARSLCYAIGASGDVHKGLLLVQAGCDAAAVPAVVAETLRQLDELAAGSFEDRELGTAVATVVGPFRALEDSLAGRMQFVAEQWLLGNDQTPAQRLATLAAVRRDDVVAAARHVWLDLEYALLPEGA